MNVLPNCLFPLTGYRVSVKQKTTFRTEVVLNTHVKLRRLSSLVQTDPNNPPTIFTFLSSISTRGGLYNTNDTHQKPVQMMREEIDLQ
jgi:hypothetical protein